MQIEQLLQLSVQKNASDLHIIPGTKPLLRIDGVLAAAKEATVFPAEETKQLLYTILTPDEQHIFEKHLVYEKALSIPDVGNFRVSFFHQMHGVGGVFRVIPSIIPTFDELSLPPVLKTLLSMPYGLILVTGPAGSGKTTTLAAMIDYINAMRANNIITIEDPIEFIHTNKKSVFNQLQVGRDTTDFATALKSSLRQDPNVILIGELRDLETMRLALTAAETGHLVLATLHASSAPLAINRFADVFSTGEKNRVRNLLSETLQAVICQTLVKRTTGGRIAAFEIMLMTAAVRHYIRKDMPSHMESAMQTNGDKGMCTLEQNLQQLVSKNLITSTVASNATITRSALADMERQAEKGKNNA